MLICLLISWDGFRLHLQARRPPAAELTVARFFFHRLVSRFLSSDSGVTGDAFHLEPCRGSQCFDPSVNWGLAGAACSQKPLLGGGLPVPDAKPRVSECSPAGSDRAPRTGLARFVARKGEAAPSPSDCSRPGWLRVSCGSRPSVPI